MMNTQWRLDSKAPSVADAFRKATPERQRRATLVACEMVLPVVGLEGDDVTEGLRAMHDGRYDDAALQGRLSALSTRFDDEYFRLEETGDETNRPKALRLFSKARAAAALVFGLSRDPAQLHEAIYEALSAIYDDPSAMAHAVEAVLR